MGLGDPRSLPCLSYLGPCLSSEVQLLAIPAASLPLGTPGTGLNSSESACRINC